MGGDDKDFVVLVCGEQVVKTFISVHICICVDLELAYHLLLRYCSSMKFKMNLGRYYCVYGGTGYVQSSHIFAV